MKMYLLTKHSKSEELLELCGWLECNEACNKDTLCTVTSSVDAVAYIF